MPQYFVSNSRFMLKSCACLLAAFAAAGIACAQSYDFNSGQSDFNATFTSNLPGGATVTYSATAGIGGSGSISTNGVSNQTEIYNTPLANFTGASITTSFYFQTRPTLSMADLVGFGIFSSTTQLFDSGDNLGYKINGTNSSTLLASTWYQLVATTTNTGTTFHTTLSLQDYGTDGVTLTGSPITIGASDSAPGTLLSTSLVYVGIYGGIGVQGGHSPDAQTTAIDNFSVSAIPEPSTYAAILGGLTLVGAAARRRRCGLSA
jgi:hypothetical protein